MENAAGYEVSGLLQDHQMQVDMEMGLLLLQLTLASNTLFPFHIPGWEILLFQILDH